MKVIGLTGGIGSGKSMVSRLLAELGATIIDADKVGHEALNPGTEVWSKVVATFGRQILDPCDTINRKKLGDVAFRNPDSLSRLNEITHPWIFSQLTTQLEKHLRQGMKIVVVEAALLVEANWAVLVDKIWVTIAPKATVLKRLKERSGMSQAKSLIRIHSQLSPVERVKHADVVIDTDCNLDELKARVKGLWRKLQLDTPPA